MTERSARLDVNPAVLVWARETAGVGIDAAAVYLGQSRTIIERWETGEESPSVSALRRLASFYGRPLAALLLSKPRPEKLPKDFRVVAASEPLTRESLLALRRAAYVQKVAGELVSGPASVEAVAATGLKEDLAESMATRERNRLGITVQEQGAWSNEYEALRTWRSAVEGLGVIVLQLSMPLEEVRGFALSGETPLICLNMSDLATARAFSLFHEYAHLLVGRDGICDSDAGPRSALADARIERFCNRFAGAFLVPREALLQMQASITPLTGPEPPDDFLFNSLTGRFGVSRQVIWYRLRQLEVIDHELFDSKWGQWSARSKRRRSGASGGGGMTRVDRAIHEGGQRLVSLVLDAEAGGRLGTSDALSLLRVRSTELADLAAAVSR